MDSTRLAMVGVVQERNRILKIVKDVRSQLITNSVSWKAVNTIYKRIGDDPDLCSWSDKCRFFNINKLGCREGGFIPQKPSCFREKDLGR